MLFTNEAIKIEMKTAEVTNADATEKKPEVGEKVEKNQAKPEYYVLVPETTESGEIKMVKRTWIQSKQQTNWRECEVIDENDDEITVHYISYHIKYDEPIKKSSDRIRARRGTNNLQRGDNVSAWYPKILSWTEAEVEEVDTEKKAN